MTIATTACIVTTQGNGVTTSFSYSFLIPYLSDGVTPAVKVSYTATNGTITVLTSGQYSITGVANPLGGTVTYNPGTPIPTGSYLTIERTQPIIQAVSVANQAFYPKTVETVADNVVLLLQQVNAAQTFMLSVPKSDPVAPVALPAASLRAGKALIFDQYGAPTVSTETFEQYILDLQAIATAAQASASASAASSAASAGSAAAANASANSAAASAVLAQQQVASVASATNTALQQIAQAEQQAAQAIISAFQHGTPPALVRPAALVVTNYSVQATDKGVRLMVNTAAAGGNVSITVNKTLGVILDNFECTVERHPADNSLTPYSIIILDQAAATVAVITSPCYGGLVPSLTIRADGTYVTARGNG